MNDEAFLAFIKSHYPYLYDIETEVRRIRDKTGFGEISALVKVTQNQVERIELLGTTQKIYKFRKNNVLT